MILGCVKLTIKINQHVYAFFWNWLFFSSRSIDSGTLQKLCVISAHSSSLLGKGLQCAEIMVQLPMKGHLCFLKYVFTQHHPQGSELPPVILTIPIGVTWHLIDNRLKIDSYIDR